MGASERIGFEPPWVGTLRAYIQPYWDGLVWGSWATDTSTGRLSLGEMQGWMLQLYPFIHTFPKFLAQNLTKVEDDYSREFFINNIRVERAHAAHWISMATGFGVPERELMALVEGARPVFRDVQSLTDWLWYINAQGSLPEAVAATSFAIEGVVGDLSRRVIHGFKFYEGQPNVRLDAKTYRWMKEHAHYDDQHSQIALRIVTQYATTDKLQTRVMFAVKRSLQLLEQALITSTYAYSARTQKAPAHSAYPSEKRRQERRSASMAIGFPERRFRERRGALMVAV